jgi:hypothetical protein
MTEENTTAAVQRYLDELAGDAPTEPVVRALLDRAVRRLHQLCAMLLSQSYLLLPGAHAIGHTFMEVGRAHDGLYTPKPHLLSYLVALDSLLP